MTLEIGSILVRSNYVCKKRYNFVSFLFVIVTYFLLSHNYVICLFNVVMLFNDVRIALYFGSFKLRTEITLQNGHLLVTFVCNQKMTKKNTYLLHNLLAGISKYSLFYYLLLIRW